MEEMSELVRIHNRDSRNSAVLFQPRLLVIVWNSFSQRICGYVLGTFTSDQGYFISLGVIQCISWQQTVSYSAHQPVFSPHLSLTVLYADRAQAKRFPRLRAVRIGQRSITSISLGVMLTMLNKATKPILCLYLYLYTCIYISVYLYLHVCVCVSQSIWAAITRYPRLTNL